MTVTCVLFVSFVSLACECDLAFGSVESFVKGADFGEALKNACASFESYKAARGSFAEGYKTEKPDSKSGAIDKAWERYALARIRELKLTPPKSTSEAATKKAAQRALPTEVINAKTIADLDAITMPNDAIEAAKLTKAIAETKVRMLTLEAKAADKTAKGDSKAKCDAFVAFFKALPPAEQDVFYALRDKRYGVVLSHMPAADIQAGLKVVQAAEKAAKKAATA